MHIRSMFLIGCLTAVAVYAAEPVTVFPAQLAGPSGADQGKLVIVGNHVVFVDDINPAYSFAIPRADIGAFTSTNGLATFTMNQPYRLPMGSGSTLVVRFMDPAGPAAISSWAGIPQTVVGSANRVIEAPPAQVGPLAYEYNVRHDDEDGRLVVGDYDVHWESFKHRDHSRTWPYADIKEFKRDGNQIKIEPYHGDSYKFQIEGGRPMTDEVYNRIGDRIVSARRR